jgi:branched-chain amino acid transport system substrate-binding protein
MMNISANHAGKGMEKLIAEFKARKGEPWMGQDPASTYGDMWIFKEAMEICKCSDKVGVANAIRNMDTTEGPAKFFPGGRVAWDEKGRRKDAKLVITQWQNGVPVVVAPADIASAAPIWPKK